MPPWAGIIKATVYMFVAYKLGTLTRSKVARTEGAAFGAGKIL